MNYLGTMYDNLINESYRLYKMNAGELSHRIKESYGLSYEEFQMFNSEAQLSKSIHQIKQHELKGRTSNWDIEQLKKAQDKVTDGTFISEMTKKGVLFGYELMPIAISVKGDIEDENTPIELLDGFKRMLSLTDIPEIDILVKVYDSISDKEWINLMMMYNSWKFVSGQGASNYMDRGFQLGLYHRYGIKFSEMVVPDRDLVSFINIYTNGKDLTGLSENYARSSAESIYKTFWNNEKFVDDIQTIHRILNISPTFTVTKKKQVEMVKPREIRMDNTGLCRILEVFISVLGSVRKLELANGIEVRSKFNFEIVTDYFSEPTLQKDFVKLSTMQVDGHITNFIKEHLREDIVKRIVIGMGYEYKKQERTVKSPINFNLSNLEF